MDKTDIVIPKTPRWLLILAYLFVPGLYIILLFCAAATIAFGGALIIIIYKGMLLESTISKIISALIALAIAVGVVVTIYQIIRGLLGKTMFEPGLLLEQEGEPQLYALVNSLCETMGSRMPDSIIIHSRSRFFVNQGRLKVFN